MKSFYYSKVISLLLYNAKAKMSTASIKVGIKKGAFKSPQYFLYLGF